MTPILVAILALLCVLAAVAPIVVARFVRPIHLALGFGATAAMWALGYVAMMGPGLVVGDLLFALMLLVLPVTGYIAATRGGEGASGVKAGLVSACANLLIVGSLFGGSSRIGVEISRDGSIVKVPLFLPSGEERSSAGAGAAGAGPNACELLGFTITPEGSPPRLVVSEVTPRGSAANALIRPGDQLVRIEGLPATSVSQLDDSVKAERTRRASLLWSGVPWVGALFVLSMLLGGVGHAIGARRPRGTPFPEPAEAFATITAGCVFLLLVTGGLVTGLEAGLAVPDWPNTFGHNMLLYPLAEMKGGIYYEHAHRLFGMLAGLTTAMLVGVVWRTDSRRWVRGVALAALAMVIAQGIMGALRVTGTLSLSGDRADLAPSLTLAIVHGIFGQVVFAMLALVAAFSTRRWKEGPAPRTLPAGTTLRTLSALFVLLLIAQLILGACYRHLQIPPDGTHLAVFPEWALHGHLTGAVLVLLMAILVGLRAHVVGSSGPSVMPRLGRLIHAAVGCQILLGIGSLVAVKVRGGAAIPVWEVAVTSGHQAVGALLLGLAALLAAWSRREFTPAAHSLVSTGLSASSSASTR